MTDNQPMDERKTQETTGSAGDTADHEGRNRRRKRVYWSTLVAAFVGLVLAEIVAGLLLMEGIERLIGRRFSLSGAWMNLAMADFAIAAAVATGVCRRYGLSDDAESVEETQRLAPPDAGFVPAASVEVSADMTRSWRLCAVLGAILTAVLIAVIVWTPTQGRTSEAGVFFWSVAGFFGLLTLLAAVAAQRHPRQRYALADADGVRLTSNLKKPVAWAKIERIRVKRVRDVFGKPTTLTLELFGADARPKKAKPLATGTFAVGEEAARESAERLVRAVRAGLLGESAALTLSAAETDASATRSAIAAADAPRVLTVGRGRAGDV